MFHHDRAREIGNRIDVVIEQLLSAILAAD